MNEAVEVGAQAVIAIEAWLRQHPETISVQNILPMPETREWLAPRLETFPERRTTAPTAGGGSCLTVGRLVPIWTVLGSVPNIEEVQLD